jgi:hypothetical protein
MERKRGLLVVKNRQWGVLVPVFFVMAASPAPPPAGTLAPEPTAEEQIKAAEVAAAAQYAGEASRRAAEEAAMPFTSVFENYQANSIEEGIISFETTSPILVSSGRAVHDPLPHRCRCRCTLRGDGFSEVTRHKLCA